MKLTCRVLLVFLALSISANAAIRSEILVRLNQVMDDADNKKMSQANKILFLDAMGREYGRRGYLIKRDTIITEDGVETYSGNADFAGIIKSAYWKSGDVRKVLPVISRDSAFNLPDVEDVSYVFVEEDGQIGFERMPYRADMIIFLYHAYPDPLLTDATEWELPDHYEGAAIFETGSDCLLKLPTQEAGAKAAECERKADRKNNKLENPMTKAITVGVTE